MNMQNPREVYGRTLVEIGSENKNVVVLEADLGKSTMTCYFEEAFPERFFEMGIAEANMTSFAAGLSLTGKIPFTNSFAVFAAGRAFDQIRQGVWIQLRIVRLWRWIHASIYRRYRHYAGYSQYDSSCARGRK
jgi:transketolase